MEARRAQRKGKGAPGGSGEPGRCWRAWGIERGYGQSPKGLVTEIVGATVIDRWVGTRGGAVRDGWVEFSSETSLDYNPLESNQNHVKSEPWEGGTKS